MSKMEDRSSPGDEEDVVGLVANSVSEAQLCPKTSHVGQAAPTVIRSVPYQVVANLVPIYRI
jgi:hypothetical protein